MGDIHRVRPASRNVRVAIVVAKFNEELTQQLLEGAMARLHDCESADADIFWVPGAFEIPQAVSWLLSEQKRLSETRWHGILALGCLIKGETDHYAVLAAEVTRRLGELSLNNTVPVTFGVLTCQTPEQAQRRADPADENKGGEVMEALLEMISLNRLRVELF
jgi:6,7-dimethyl-8-ribityllumazine synthase